MEKKEKIFVFLVIMSIFAAFVFHKRQSGNEVFIYVDGEIYAQVPIDADDEISVNGKNVVTLEKGRVYVSYADCPDKLCMRQGEIGKEGGVIVCLPNKMTVEIKEKR